MKYESKLKSYMFFLAYGIYLIFSIISTSFYSKYISNRTLAYIMILCCLIIFAKEIFVKTIKIKELVYLFVVILLTLIMVYHINSITMIPVFFLLYGGRNTSFDKISKFSFVVIGTLFIFILFSANAGWILNYKYTSGDRIRNYLGFKYSLYPQMIALNLTLLYFYINKHKISILKGLSAIAINYWLFTQTDSRLSFYLVVFFITIILIIYKKKKQIIFKKEVFQKIMVLSYLLCSLLSFYLIFNYNSSNKTMYELNKYFENRINIAKESLDKYHINLLGHKVEYVGNGLDQYGNVSTEEYSYVDNLYLHILEKYGIIFFLIIIIIYTKSCSNMIKDDNHIGVLILSILALHGLIDALSFNLYYNTFLFLVGNYLIYQKKGVDSNETE